ncbi:MAG: helix-turn-helix domain-containing protein, partial [Campylobacter sp.]|nr:helix-turn-helix domain-containing protein [Campylobacter sp.]
SQELEGFSTYEINTYNTNIMPIDDYIKHCIISHQDTYSDTQLASILGISRKSLWERRRKYDIAKKK